MSRQPGPPRARRLEDEFYRIINMIENRDWNEFARSTAGLGLPRSRIDDIRSDYSNDIREQKYQMLSLWQRRTGHRATIEVLSNTVAQFLDHLTQQEQEPTTPAQVGLRNATMANDDVENNQCVGGRGRSQSHGSNRPVGLESFRSQVVHPDNDRWFEDNSSRTRANNSTSTTTSQYRTHESTVRFGTTDEGVASNIQATTTDHRGSGEEKVEGSNCSRPRTSSETVPKEVETGLPQNKKVTGNVAKILQKAFHPHSNIDPNSNVKISVIGDHAIGIQTNYYPTDYKSSKTKEKLEKTEKLADYCTKVTSSQVEKSNKDSYDDHLEKNIYIYKISHDPKGVVLLVNNSFPDQSNARHGSESDLKHMDAMWKDMGCKVFQRLDLSSVDTLPTLKRFALSHHAYNSDFVAVVIMSHGGLEGGEDVFYSADGKAVKIHDVLDIFNNANARRLQGIPKLFFFQICRGDTIDKGVDRNSPEENSQDLTSLFESLEVTMQRASGSNNEDFADALGTPSERVPIMSDCMISFATLPGYKAIRNNQNGSWYVNAIVNIFSRYAKDQHVIDLMTMVNAAVEKKTASSKKDEVNNGKEMSNFLSTLTKKLFLFPGFPVVDDDDGF